MQKAESFQWRSNLQRSDWSQLVDDYIRTHASNDRFSELSIFEASDVFVFETTSSTTRDCSVPLYSLEDSDAKKGGV